jgi:hypothetical protein
MTCREVALAVWAAELDVSSVAVAHSLGCREHVRTIAVRLTSREPTRPTNAFIRDGDSVFPTYFINGRASAIPWLWPEP